MRGMRAAAVGLLAAVMVSAWPGVAMGYTYLGNCVSTDQYTMDINKPNTPSGIDGVQMTLYQIPGSSLWATCTYAGAGAGHMAELLSLQSTSGIVQVGIAKFTGGGGTSWSFIYTPQDDGSGHVVAVSWFPETPVASRTYVFTIQRLLGSENWDWQFTIKDINTGVSASSSSVVSHWASTNNPWWGGETENANDTMGRLTQINSFITYQLSEHTASGWSSYLSQAAIDGATYKAGVNSSIVNKTSNPVGGTGGFYIWTT
jgi:hypothetical protein